MNKIYQNRWLPVGLLIPQLLLIGIFFYWPVIQAFFWSVYLEPPFGGEAEFVGLENFSRVLNDEQFYNSINRSIVFMITASSSAVIIPLILAVAADRHIRLAKPARNILLWPKAVAGASIGMAFSILLNPHVGLLSPINALFPGFWNPGLNGTDANIMLNIAYIWRGIPFNFIILLAGLQGLPQSMIQAAAVDGAGPWRRLFEIQIPLLSPQLFFCMVLEVTASFASAFALVDSMTQGGPGGATNLFVYKIYVDAFKSYDLSGASTQTVILMAIVMLLTCFQFFFLEKRVKYNR
jgi:sn-glycerol 3-phosphate transport system permease protein